MKLFGAPGCGSAVAEVVLQLANQPYEYLQTSVWEQNEHFEELMRVNPQSKVPTLVFDDGTVMTESAAILLYFAEKVPGMVPTEAGKRAVFLRWMLFIPMYNCAPPPMKKKYPKNPTAPRKKSTAATRIA